MEFTDKAWLSHTKRQKNARIAQWLIIPSTLFGLTNYSVIFPICCPVISQQASLARFLPQLQRDVVMYWVNFTPNAAYRQCSMSVIPTRLAARE